MTKEGGQLPGSGMGKTDERPESGLISRSCRQGSGKRTGGEGGGGSRLEEGEEGHQGGEKES